MQGITNRLIIDEIINELLRAEDKFPYWPKDIIHAAAIVNEESGELIRASIQLTYEDGNIEEVKKEAIQTAAMCIRFLKHLNTYNTNDTRYIHPGTVV